MSLNTVLLPIIMIYIYIRLYFLGVARLRGKYSPEMHLLMGKKKNAIACFAANANAAALPVCE